MTSLITRIVSERTGAGQCGGSAEIGYSECMSFEDKISHKAQELRGRIKRNAGQVTGDRRLEAEGRAEERAGNLRQAGQKIKEALFGSGPRRPRY